ncbi:MAG: SUF system NifU family Fe-S cluster assembly protein [Bacilli bacterium]|nr:SUF system NifU family Fe-S cluster assembly protein [Bacilli bacterium]
MDANLKREIILDNYLNPVNKGLVKDKDYIKGKKSSPVCIDHFNVQIKIKDGKIEDIRFDGEACAIATSAISISISKLIGKTTKQALKIIDNYEKMLNGEKYNEDLLEELIVYSDIYKQPSRKNCATIGIQAIKDLIEKNM